MALTHVCPLLTEKIQFQKKDEFTNESIYNILQSIAPNPALFEHACWWQRKQWKGCPVAPTFTEEGLCSAFNIQNSHEMYTDEYVL